jgi:hypothetical protein
METISVIFPSIDWVLLRHQKLALIQCIGNQDDELLEGLLGLIDHIQDNAVASKQFTELQVFGFNANDIL